jgi:hypothetical protein
MEREELITIRTNKITTDKETKEKIMLKKTSHNIRTVPEKKGERNTEQTKCKKLIKKEEHEKWKGERKMKKFN